MRNNVIKSIVFACLLALSSTMVAQAVGYAEAVTIDEYGRRTQDLSKLPKMERDIIILKNVLNDLFNERENNLYGSRSAEGIHIPGKGVMFNMTGRSVFGNVVLVESVGLADTKVEEKADERSTDEMNAEIEELMKEKSAQFLINYASLLSELKSGEQVMLNVDYNEIQERKKSETWTYSVGRSNNVGKRMVSAISQDDLEAFMNGNLSESAARDKIDFKIIDRANSDKPDVKIFAGIMDDLFSTAEDGKFRKTGKTTYSYFDGFGLMYNMRFSTNGSSRVFFATASTVVSGTKVDSDAAKKEEERMAALEESYPEFEKMIKQHVLDYGRTLRSLNDNEVIIFNVDLGSAYRKSKLPRSIQLIIPKALINDYAQGKTPLNTALEQIDIKKLSTAVGGSSSYIYSVPDAPRPATAVGRLRRSTSQGQH